MSERPDERQLDRELHRTPIRTARHDLRSKLPSQRHKSEEARTFRDRQVIAAVLTSTPELMLHEKWVRSSRSEKVAVFSQINRRIAEKLVGAPALGAVIEGKTSSLVYGQNNVVGVVARSQSEQAGCFARDVAKLNLFSALVHRLGYDTLYRDTVEGKQLASIMGRRPNRVGERYEHFLTTPTLMLGSHVMGAVRERRIIPFPAGEQNEAVVVEKPSSMEERRLSIANTCLTDPRVMTKAAWQSLWKSETRVLELFKDLNTVIAKSESRKPLIAELGERKTALYVGKDRVTASLHRSDARDRLGFLKAVGMLNMRYFQEVATEKPEKYPEHAKAAFVAGRDGKEHDIGRVNSDEVNRAYLNREKEASGRIDIQTVETSLVARAISEGHARLTEMEEERRPIRL